MAIFLRSHERRKDGKINTYWSLVENRRVPTGGSFKGMCSIWAS